MRLAGRKETNTTNYLREPNWAPFFVGIKRICLIFRPHLRNWSPAHMTEQQIKEKLSKSYLDLLIHNGGHKQMKPEDDHGVDLYIMRVQKIIRASGIRYLDSTDFIAVQLKCTCVASIEEDEDWIKYDLEVKSYNDLVDRVRNNATVPLFLVLMVLPDETERWVEVRDEEIALAKCAYWYRPESTTLYTDNGSRKRIYIPKTNKLDGDFIKRQFIALYD